MEQILTALNGAEAVCGRPTMIIARTVKGKGVSFMENKSLWHGTPPDEKQLEQDRRELAAGTDK